MCYWISKLYSYCRQGRCSVELWTTKFLTLWLILDCEIILMKMRWLVWLLVLQLVFVILQGVAHEWARWIFFACITALQVRFYRLFMIDESTWMFMLIKLMLQLCDASIMHCYFWKGKKLTQLHYMKQADSSCFGGRCVPRWSQRRNQAWTQQRLQFSRKLWLRHKPVQWGHEKV